MARMLVAICDDDPSARFVMKRVLTQRLGGCTTVECSNGVEALSRLEQGDVDLLVLDVQMPQLDGIETLEAIRASPTLKSLPVVMVSSERRESIIRRLVRLGIDGYVLKPLRAEKLMAALEPLRERIVNRQRRAPGATSTPCTLGPGTPALLVDGNLDYRHFFVSQAQKFGPIIELSTGAAALARFRASPVSLVFLGADLGVMRADLLVPKLRALTGEAGQTPLRIVMIADGDAGPAAAADVDDTMARTFVPDLFAAEIRRFTGPPPTVAAVTTMLGELGPALTSAARQVFEMMLDAQLESVALPADGTELAGATVDLTITGRHVLPCRILATPGSWTALAARMLGVDAGAVGEEEQLSTSSELVNLVTGRLHAVLTEQGVACECSAPRMLRPAVPWQRADLAAPDAHEQFRLQGTSAELYVSLQVADAGSLTAGAPS